MFGRGVSTYTAKQVSCSNPKANGWGFSPSSVMTTFQHLELSLSSLILSSDETRHFPANWASEFNKDVILPNEWSE